MKAVRTGITAASNNFCTPNAGVEVSAELTFRRKDHVILPVMLHQGTQYGVISID